MSKVEPEELATVTAFLELVNLAVLGGFPTSVKHERNRVAIDLIESMHLNGFGLITP